MQILEQDKLLELRIRKDALLPSAIKLSGAGGHNLPVLGGIFLDIVPRNKQQRSTKQFVYITDDNSPLFLSKDAQEVIRVISRNYPNEGHETNLQLL